MMLVQRIVRGTYHGHARSLLVRRLYSYTTRSESLARSEYVRKRTHVMVWGMVC